MPRDGSGVYTAPFPDVVTATPVSSTVYNGFVHDITTDLNTPRPIVAGGTSASSAAAARIALAAETYGQVITNYDSASFLPGSFYSDSAATSPPVVGHAFTGNCAFVDGNNMYLQAFDRDDASQPGAVWIRQKKAGVWSSWAKAQALNIVGTPSVNQITTWQSSTALQGVTITGLVKGNGASAPTAAVAGTDYAPATSGASILKGNGGGGFSNAVAGLDYQAVDGELTAIAGLTSAADRLPYFTGVNSAALAVFTTFGRSLVDDVDAAAARATIGAVATGTAVLTVKVQKFTASGTYTPSTGMLYCIVECWGAGGGGGGTISPATNVGLGGGGGGAGSKSKLWASAATIGASQTVTIGVHGNGAAAGNNAGSAGGDTSVGSLCVGKGGGGGPGNGASGGFSVGGGVGGTAGTGDVAGTGQNGSIGPSFSAGSCTSWGGAGGSSEVGAGGMTPTNVGAKTDGNAASGFAAGGCGGQSFSTLSASAGGNGSDGLVVITEFCSQ